MILKYINTQEGVHGVMNVVVGDGHSDSSSDPAHG